MNHDMLLYKLSQIGIAGRTYGSIKAMYRNPVSCVNIGQFLTDWFPISLGVRQGDSLSPTLFAIFINDLATEVKEAKQGIYIDTDYHLPILLYADDVVLIAPSHTNMQNMLDIVTSWCRRWGMSVNASKSQVVHVRNHQRPLCDKDLFLCLRELSYVSDYKYLGCWINEFVNNEKTVEALTLAAGRSFGRIVNIFKRMGDMGYETYDTLCHSYVLPVANYAAGVWGFKCFPAPQVLLNRMTRFFLGVHRFAPLPATKTEMDWLEMKMYRWLGIMRLLNRITAMSPERLPRRVLTWDYKVGAKGWLRDALEVCNYLNIPAPTELKYVYDLEPIQRRMLVKCREEWKEEAGGMSKLSMYVIAKDFAEIGTLVKSNLPRNERSLLARLLCGILPLELEKGRWKRTGREIRYCKTCDDKKVETEFHFVFQCSALSEVRETKLDPLLKENPEVKSYTEAEKLKWLITKDNIKTFGKIIACLFQKRQDILYKKK